jgi:N-acetylmuramoyl-L-alanine amidase
MKKIYLSPSEQPENLYSYGNTNEKVQCRRIAAVAEKALKRHGFEVINATADRLSVRCKEADEWGADLYIPIHTNACNGKVSGTRIFCYGLSGEGYKACKAIYNVLAPLTPGKSENIQAMPGLYEVKNPKAPTVYIEVDFHDVPDVAKWIIEHTEEIGEAICKGVCNYYGVTYKAQAVAENKTEKLYRVQVGAYSVKANAEAMLAKLKKAGFNGFIKEE